MKVVDGLYTTCKKLKSTERGITSSKRFYRALRSVIIFLFFDPCISRVRFLEVNFWC